MKRTLLDITQKISRKVNRVVLTPVDLENDTTYWIFEAKGWKLVDILPEIQYRTTQDRVIIKVNTQSISNDDFILDCGKMGMTVKFIRNKFQYILEAIDYIEMQGDIERYA